MKITVVGRQMSVRESLKDLVEKKLSKFDRFFDEEAEDDFSPEISISNLEWEREALSCRLSELQDRLFDLEDQEPDDYTCAAYDSWERRKNRLGEQIFDLEDQITEMENRISFGTMGMYSQAV